MAKVKFTTTIDDAILEQAKIEAIKLKISTAGFLEMLIKKYFTEKSEQTGRPD